MRVCRRCEREQALEAFAEYRPGHRRWVCRLCVGARRSERYREDPEFRERVLQRSRRRDRAAENLRLRKLYRRPDQQAKRLARTRRNAAAVNAKNRAWRAANREKARAWGRRDMRRRRLGLGASDALLAWTDVLVADPCSYCGGVATGIDHIAPISAGGENAAENFTGSCIDCNRQKRATPLLLFLAAR